MNPEPQKRIISRCPVAEFVGNELEAIDKARAEHLRCYQEAKSKGLPLPDPDDFMPERVWTKTAAESDPPDT